MTIIAVSQAKEEDQINIKGYKWIGSPAKAGASGDVGVLVNDNLITQAKAYQVINKCIETERMIKVFFSKVCIIGIYGHNDSKESIIIEEFY